MNKMKSTKAKENQKKNESLNKQKIANRRNASLDVVRITALFCVISVHFFLNNGFYGETISGTKMLIMVIIRTGFMVCVPLFLILTGYLMRKKVLSKKYYSGLIKTLVVYILASLACLLYKVFFLDIEYSILGVIEGILNFSIANYSWYIEMYIGLFLLIPFLNLIYNNLKSKKEKKILILTMLLLTSIPTITNIYTFSNGIGWDMLFGQIKANDKLLPFWWHSLYPVTYYFIGAYLNEYKPQINRKLNLILLLFFIIIFGLYNYFYSYGNKFIFGDYQSWGSIQNVIMTVLLFTLIININFDNLNRRMKIALKRISDCCLGAYLVSYIFDDYFYSILNNNVPEVVEKLKYFIIIVPCVFICSILLSFTFNLFYDKLIKIIRYTKNILVLKYNNKKGGK